MGRLDAVPFSRRVTRPRCWGDSRTEARVNALVKILALVLLATASAAAPNASDAPATPAPARRPNILLIIADDLRDSGGGYGQSQIKTPHLDALASSGGTVRFDRAYAQYPVCNPSRASFLTGLRPDRTGVLSNTVRLRDQRPDVVTWPQWLRQHGWRTASFGKVFHTVGKDTAERDFWMDTARSWDEAAYDTAEARPGRQIAGRNLTQGALKWCEWAALDSADEDMPDGQFASRAIAAMERAGAQPWFIAVGFHRPHDPFVVPARYFDLYPEGALTLWRDPAGQTPAPPLAVPPGAFREAFAQFTDAERLEFLRAYAAGVSFMDAQVGRVLGAVDRLGLWGNTLVIFMGDNGYHLGERDWWNKDTLFERSTRVPLLVRPPAAKAATPRPAAPMRVSPVPVELVDLFPTVLDFASLPAPQPLAGRSLRPQLEDPTRAGKGAATTVVRRGNQRGETVRTPEWRYTRWSDGTVELYDERHDPEETRNLAADPARAAICARLQALLDAQLR